MKKIFIKLMLFSFVLSALTANAQDFVKTFGGSDCEEGFAITHTQDGGFIVSGYTTTYGSGGSSLTNRHDFMLSKFDSNGNWKWSKTLGAYDAFDLGWGIIQTSTGEYVVTGSTAGFGAGSVSTLDLLLAKFDVNGNNIWTKKLGAAGLERGYSICESTDGKYLVAGITNSFGAGGLDLLLAKFDTSGSVIWTKTVGGNLDDFGSYYGPVLMQTSYKSIVVAGTTLSFGAASEDMILCEFDSTGNHQWTRIIRGDSVDRGNAVAEAADGGYVIAGTSLSFDGGFGDVILSKFDINGSHLWTKTIGGDSTEYVAAMVSSPNGGFVVTGGTRSTGTLYPDILITALDSTGAHVWTRTLRLGTSDTRNYGKSITRLTDNTYAVSGEIVVPANPEAPVVRLTETGGLCMGSTLTFTSINQIPTILTVTPTITTPIYSLTSVSPIITTPTPIIANVCQTTTDIQENDHIIETESNFIIYPNPSKGVIKIETSCKSGQNLISICDLTGRILINKETFQKTTIIDIGNLKNGIYILKLINNNKVESKIVIKEWPSP